MNPQKFYYQNEIYFEESYLIINFIIKIVFSSQSSKLLVVHNHVCPSCVWYIGCNRGLSNRERHRHI